jgi:hypothetical protein
MRTYTTNNYTLLNTLLEETYKEPTKQYNPTGSVITPYLTTDYKTKTATALAPPIYQPPRTINGTTYLPHIITPSPYLDEQIIQQSIRINQLRNSNKTNQYIIITDAHYQSKSILTKPINELHDPLHNYKNNTYNDTPYSVKTYLHNKKQERLQEAKEQLIQQKGLHNKTLEEIYLPKYQLDQLEIQALQDVYNYQITHNQHNKAFIVRINIQEHLQGNQDKFKVKLHNKNLQTPIYIKKILQQLNVTLYLQDINTREYISYTTPSHITPTWDHYNNLYSCRTNCSN